MLIFIFFLNIFFIFETFKPPSLKIVGFFIRSIIVDSNPILHLPPSRIYFILEPNSSFTSFACTVLNLLEIFALGAAKG